MERWLTYQQAGELFGMSAEAARQRTRRLGWRTQPGNEGKTLVLVPEDVAVRPRVRPAVQTGDQTLGNPRILAAETRADRADDRADKANARADAADADRRAAEARADAERARADRAEQALAGERGRADAVRDQRDGLRAEVAETRGERDQAREALAALERSETARKALGRLARLLAAWRGE